MGDEKEFLAYYDKYKNKIFTFFWYRVGFNQCIAEDLTSEVFLKAIKNFDSFDQARSFQAWIYAIAKNHLADHYHKSGREIRIDEVEEKLTSCASEIITHIDNKQEVSMILEHVNELKSYHREVLLLRFVDGLSNSEIKELLGKEEGAVRAQISRALQELRKKLSYLK